MSNTSNSLVSVVIPTYNRTQQTMAAIDSVLAQTYPHVEVIVVDDGSTDGSREALQRFIEGKHGAQRIVLLAQPNQGASTARNLGIAKAQGEYIAFLDSDDTWLPDKLEWQMRAFQELGRECGGCITDAHLVNSKGMDLSSFRLHGRNYEQTIGIDRMATISIAQSFCGFWISSLLARVDVIRQIGGFNPDISFVEDRDLHFRLSLVTTLAYVNIQLVVTDRNPSPPGSTCRPWDKPEVQFRQQQGMLENWLSMDGVLPPDVRLTVERGLGALHSHWTNWYLEKGRYAEARDAIAKAVRYKITPGTTVKFALTWLWPALARKVTPKTRPIGTGGHAS